MRLLIVLALLSACVHSLEPVWIPGIRPLHVPALVAWPSGDEYKKPMRLAMDAFPCGLFVASGMRSPDVVFRQEDGTTKPCGTEAPFESARAQAKVYYCKGHTEVWGEFSRLDSTQVYLLFQHELGHAAGLKDDPSQRPIPEQGPIVVQPAISVMAHNVLSHANRQDYGYSVPMLSHVDEAALKDRYCP